MAALAAGGVVIMVAARAGTFENGRVGGDFCVFVAICYIERRATHFAHSSNNKNEHFKIMTNDVSRAYFYAPIQEGHHIYVKLPPEDIFPGEEQMCEKLNYSMYGRRRAPTNWQTH